jgi:hypothetical protein
MIWADSPLLKCNLKAQVWANMPQKLAVHNQQTQLERWSMELPVFHGGRMPPSTDSRSCSPTKQTSDTTCTFRMGPWGCKTSFTFYRGNSAQEVVIGPQSVSVTCSSSSTSLACFRIQLGCQWVPLLLAESYLFVFWGGRKILVMVYLSPFGCYKQNTYFKPTNLWNTEIAHSSGDWKSKIKVPPDLVCLVRALLLDGVSLLHPHVVEGTKPPGFFYKGTKSHSWRPYPHDFVTS